jgi:hypothetical protein
VNNPGLWVENLVQRMPRIPRHPSVETPRIIDLPLGRLSRRKAGFRVNTNKQNKLWENQLAQLLHREYSMSEDSCMFYQYGLQLEPMYIKYQYLVLSPSLYH